MPRLLELCGAGPLGVALGELGWEVVRVDDIESWDFSTYPSGHFDLAVMAGPSRPLSWRVTATQLKNELFEQSSNCTFLRCSKNIKVEMIADYFQPRAFLCAPGLGPR